MTIGNLMLMALMALLGIVAGFFMGLSYATSKEIEELRKVDKKADWE
jgi:hypothetical protein